jgi:hypothetical protein
MSSKSLGDLFVSLSLRSTDFTKGVAAAADTVERFSGKAAAALNDISGGFSVLGGVAAGALALAATGAEKLSGVSTNAKTETEKLQRATTLLAVEVSEVLLPAVRAMTDGVLRLVGVWRSLDESTRENIGSLLGWSAALGAGLMGVSKGLVIFKGFFELAVVLAPALGAMLVPLLAVAAAMAGLLLLAGAIKSATGLTFAQVGEAFGSAAAWILKALGLVWDGVQAVLEAIETGFEVAFRGVVATVRAATKLILDTVLAVAGKIGSVMAPLARGGGANGIASAWESAQVATSDGLLEAFDRGVAALEQGARKAAKALPGALAQASLGSVGAIIDVKMIGNDLKSALQGAKEILGDAYKALGIEDVLNRLETFGKAGMPGSAADAAADAKRRDLSLGVMNTDMARLDAVDASRGAEAESLSGMGAFRTLAEEMEREADLESLALAAASESRIEMQNAQRAEFENGQAMFKEMGQYFADLKAEAAASARRVKDQLVGQALGALGELGQIISNAVKAAQAGGPWAALASVVLDIVSRSKGFKEMIDRVMQIVDMLAQAFSSLFQATGPILGAVSNIVKVLVDALKPLMDLMAENLSMLAAPLQVIGKLLSALGPIIALVIKPLVSLAGPLLHALFDILRIVGAIILTVVQGIGYVWNAILDAITWVLKAIDALPFVDMEKAIRAVQSVKIDTDEIGRQRDDLLKYGWDDAMKDATDAASDFGKGVNAATQEMLNVPAIWKRMLRTGQAQDGQLPPGTSGGSGPGGSGAPTQGNNTTINIIGYDLAAATEHAMRLQEQEELRLRGRDGNNRFASPRLVTP